MHTERGVKRHRLGRKSELPGGGVPGWGHLRGGRLPVGDCFSWDVGGWGWHLDFKMTSIAK